MTTGDERVGVFGEEGCDIGGQANFKSVSGINEGDTETEKGHR